MTAFEKTCLMALFGGLVLIGLAVVAPMVYAACVADCDSVSAPADVYGCGSNCKERDYIDEQEGCVDACHWYDCDECTSQYESPFAKWADTGKKCKYNTSGTWWCYLDPTLEVNLTAEQKDAKLALKWSCGSTESYQCIQQTGNIPDPVTGLLKCCGGGYIACP